MSDCCQGKEDDLKGLAQRQSKVLWTVLIINLVMFFVEMTFGLLSDSLSLIGDSLDMLGDSLAYGSTLYVLGGTLKEKIKASQFKALLMFLTGAFVFYRAYEKFMTMEAPKVELMMPVALLVLLANLVCLFLLARHRNDDFNFKSVWVCSRNDIVANVSVLLATGLVFFFQSPWPDILLGLAITVLFVNSALSVFRESLTLSKEAEQ